MLTYRKIYSPAEEAQPKCNQQPIYPHLYHRFLLQTEARGDDTTCKRYEKKNESPKSLQPFMECYINKQDWRNSCIAGYFRSQSKTLWKKKLIQQSWPCHYLVSIHLCGTSKRSGKSKITNLQNSFIINQQIIWFHILRVNNANMNSSYNHMFEVCESFPFNTYFTYNVPSLTL